MLGGDGGILWKVITCGSGLTIFIGGGLGVTPRGGPKEPCEYLNMMDQRHEWGWSCDALMYGGILGCNKVSSWYDILGGSSIMYRTMGWRANDLVFGDREASSIWPSNVSPSYKQTLEWVTSIICNGWGEGSLSRGSKGRIWVFWNSLYKP